jgi:predicted tellurium resistance membrane protein TerC
LVHTHDRTNLHDRRVRLLLARPDCPCGLFLLVKGTREIHEGIEGEAEDEGGSPVVQSLTAAINQMAVIDLVFSVDFIITAVGMAKHVGVMIGAVMVAIIVMYFASGPVAAFIERHPTTKMLALSFLLLIGAALLADAFHFHIPRGYIYFAMPSRPAWKWSTCSHSAGGASNRKNEQEQGGQQGLSKVKKSGMFAQLCHAMPSG